MSSAASEKQISPKVQMLAFIGCLLLAVSMSAFGLSLANIQSLSLQMMNGMGSFSLITALTSASLCVMTPIGGSLMDILGTRKVVFYFGSIVCVCGILLAFTTNLTLYIVLRVLLSAANGAFASIPFVAIRQIYPPAQVPKMVGYLSSALAVGGFLGSWFAGILVDNNMMGLACCFPVLFLAPGIFLVCRYLPETPKTGAKRRLDWGGIFLLALNLFCLVFTLNYGPILGWTSGLILAGAAGMILALIAFIWWENRSASPLIPLHLFKQKAYVLVLMIAGLCIIYLTAINVYVPQAVQQLMGQSATVSGTLQIPRTILAILVPGFAGVWVAKSYKNYWKALAGAAILIAVASGCLVFIGKNMPLWFVIAMIALTGIADSLRTVATTPAAQSLLKPQDMGIGTSMVGFIISLMGVIASALFSIAYNSLTAATPGPVGLTEGIDTVLLISCAAAVISLLLDVLLWRPIYQKIIENKAAAKAE